MAGVRVGIFGPVGPLGPDPRRRAETMMEIERSAIDHVWVGDHVSFFVGAGMDALINATALLAQSRLPCYVALYLLALRHPVVVARQLASIAELAPGRLTLGVGIGGEDPHELEICGVDPRTRGKRMDECLEIVRALGKGEPVSFDGRFFSLRDALILPGQSPSIPLIVGGRSDAAVRRAARLGDGWVAIWVSPQRFASATGQIAELARASGRNPAVFEHALNVWCGFDGARVAARERLADAMQAFYRRPFEAFERYSPYGSPEDIVEFLLPYVEAGCGVFNLLPVAADFESAVAGVADVRSLLNKVRS